MLSRPLTVAVGCGFGLLLGASAFFVIAAENQSDPQAAEKEAPLSPAQKEVVAAVEEYNHAVARRDIEKVMAAFVPGPETMVLGTGKGESWRGGEEIREAHLNFFKGFDKERAEPVWRHISVAGDVAWLASLSHFVDEREAKKNEFFMNISAVFQKKDGRWLITLLHISNPTGPEKQE
jgi:uncharacterized protein (TIGR02246 family)